MKVFSKQKMMERLEKEGRAHLVDEESAKIMDALDGKEARKNDFKALIYDELEYYVSHEGENYPVNANDCVDK